VPGIFDAEQTLTADAFVLDAFVKGFNFAVGLRITHRSPDVLHGIGFDELFKVFGEELRTVVTDQRRVFLREGFPGFLHYHLDIILLHMLAKFVVDIEP